MIHKLNRYLFGKRNNNFCIVSTPDLADRLLPCFLSSLIQTNGFSHLCRGIFSGCSPSAALSILIANPWLIKKFIFKFGGKNGSQRRPNHIKYLHGAFYSQDKFWNVFFLFILWTKKSSLLSYTFTRSNTII